MSESKTEKAQSPLHSHRPHTPTHTDRDATQTVWLHVSCVQVLPPWRSPRSKPRRGARGDARGDARMGVPRLVPALRTLVTWARGASGAIIQPSGGGRWPSWPSESPGGGGVQSGCRRRGALARTPPSIDPPSQAPWRARRRKPCSAASVGAGSAKPKAPGARRHNSFFLARSTHSLSAPPISTHKRATSAHVISTCKY